jgi:hypothetical protein
MHNILKEMIGQAQPLADNYAAVTWDITAFIPLTKLEYYREK